MSTPVGNSAANASGNGPALGYSLKLWLFILFMLICVISINMFTCFILLLKVIEILLVYTFNFGIKIYRKLPRYLTRTYLCLSIFSFLFREIWITNKFTMNTIRKFEKPLLAHNIFDHEW